MSFRLTNYRKIIKPIVCLILDMVESFGDLIRNGYVTWKRNLNICFPFILRPIFIFILFLLLALPFVALLFSSGLKIDDVISTGFSAEKLFVIPGMVAFLVLAAIIFFLAAIAIYAFFQVGAISMTREAIEKDETSLQTMWASGKRHYIKMALSYVLTGLIWIAAVLVVTLPFFVAMAVPGISGLLFGLGFMIAFVVMLLVFLALALVPYALVIDDLGPVEAVEASIRFFREHQFDVLPIPIVVFVISLAIGIIGALLGLTGSMYVSVAWSFINQIIDQIVIASLATVWWTRLYLDRTGKMLNKEDASSNT